MCGGEAGEEAAAGLWGDRSHRKDISGDPAAGQKKHTRPEMGQLRSVCPGDASPETVPHFLNENYKASG